MRHIWIAQGILGHAQPALKPLQNNTQLFQQEDLDCSAGQVQSTSPNREPCVRWKFKSVIKCQVSWITLGDQYSTSGYFGFFCCFFFSFFPCHWFNGAKIIRDASLPFVCWWVYIGSRVLPSQQSHCPKNMIKNEGWSLEHINTEGSRGASNPIRQIAPVNFGVGKRNATQM